MISIVVALSALSCVITAYLLLRFLALGKNNSQQEARLKQISEQNSLLQTHISEHLMRSFDSLRGQILGTLKDNAERTDREVSKLTDKTDLRLKEISGQVEKRLSEGFEKTNATFQNVITRLSLIDEAQKKITELSSNVIGLQEILADKRSRGAFGEVQLSGLVSNMLPENSYKLQHSFPSNVRVDCILFLPEPSGNICIDSKFPLENYQKMKSNDFNDLEKAAIAKQFKKDIKKHIHDIASKYIIPGETTDSAIMFIPAEAVFAEIHGFYPELVQEAQRARVWLTSPTTLMAILTTMRAVLKDDATRKQIHIIQEHLTILGKDFSRFQERMGKLAKHIELAHNDVESVHTSARKITSRFDKIERVDLNNSLLEQERIENNSI
jgi:DNA recombination protein RmuC